MHQMYGQGAAMDVPKKGALPMIMMWYGSVRGYVVLSLWRLLVYPHLDRGTSFLIHWTEASFNSWA